MLPKAFAPGGSTVTHVGHASIARNLQIMKLKRRHFLPLVGSALAAAALAACGGSDTKAVEDIVPPDPSGGGKPAGVPVPPPPPPPGGGNPGGATVPPVRPGGEVTLTGPTGGLEKSLSGVFTVGHTGTLTGTVKVTPNDGAGGKFWSTSIQDNGDGFVYLSPSTPKATFLYAPSSAGQRTITLTNDGALSNPASRAYTSTASTPGSATPFRLVRGGATIGAYATLQRCKDIGGWRSGDDGVG